MLLRIASILLPVLSIVLIGYLYGRRHATTAKLAKNHTPRNLPLR